MQQALSVILVLALLGGALWWLRRKGAAQFTLKPRRGSRRKAMRVIDRLVLTPQHSLHLVSVAGRTMLIAASPGGCSVHDGVPPETELERAE